MIHGRYLFVHQGYELYGSDRMLILSIKALLSHQPEASVDVILPSEGALSTALQGIPGVKVQISSIGVVRRYDLKKFRLKFLWKIVTFPRLIPLMNRYDRVYINSVVVADFILAARFTKTGCLVHIHEIPSATARRIFNPLLVFSKANLLFVSEACRNGYRIPASQRRHIIPNGCAPVEVGVSQPDGNDVLHLLMLGRISKAKGHWLLTEALRMLPTEIQQNIRVKIVGDVFGNQPELLLLLNREIESSGLKHLVSLQPFSQEPGAFFGWCGAVVVPSLIPESFGLVAIEAMSAGRPVIAANHGGLTEIVVHNETGLLFEPGNPKALAEAITFALQHPNAMKEMGLAGRKRYEEHFTEEIYIRNFQKII